jgi:hypothetical protein
MPPPDQPSNQLPAIIPPTALATTADAELRLVPALIAAAEAPKRHAGY